MIYCLLGGGLGNLLIQIFCYTYLFGNNIIFLSEQDKPEHSEFQSKQLTLKQVFPNLRKFKILTIRPPDLYAEQKAGTTKFNFNKKNISYFELKELGKKNDISVFGQFFDIFHKLYDANKFRNLFKISSSIKPKMKLKNYIAVHFRRHDFLKHSHFDIVPIQYYEKLLKNVGNKQIIVFCHPKDRKVAEKLFLLINPNIQFVDEPSQYHDFLLLSKADILINSNSTFSYTASLMNKNKCIFPSRKLEYGGDNKFLTVTVPPNDNFYIKKTNMITNKKGTRLKDLKASDKVFIEKYKN